MSLQGETFLLNGVMTEEEILKEVVTDDDDLDKDKEKKDLEIVNESIQC